MKPEDLAAIKTLLKSNDPEVASVLSDQTILKSLDTMDSLRLREDELHGDHWTEGHDGKVPGKETIKIGPEQRSSGDGAAKMVRDYSEPAPQHGITLEVEKISRMLEPMASSIKSLVDAISKQSAGLDVLSTATLSLVRKAEEAKEEEEDEEEHVKKSLAKAKIYLAKAEEEEDKADDEMDEAKCESMKSEVARLRAKARNIIRKARVALAAIDSPALTKSLKKLAVKAEMEEDEDKEESAKSEISEIASALSKATDPAVKAGLTTALEAAKAKGKDAKGNQADRADPATGNQDDAAIKALAADLASVKKAVEGVGMLSMTVNQMMDRLSGLSRSGGVPPALAISKSEPVVATTAAATLERIDELEAGGSLSVGEAAEGREIVRYYTLASQGVVSMDVAKARIEKAPAGIVPLVQGLAA